MAASPSTRLACLPAALLLGLAALVLPFASSARAEE